MPKVIALPVLWASIRLHLDKGKRWNALEHLLLHAVCAEPRTAPELASISKLPRRLVIEVMIRLMRVGWVELVAGNNKSGFRSTVAGHRVVRYESLPSVTRPLSRKASFAIEQVSGAVFRGRELTIYTQARLDKVRQTTDVILLPRETSFRRPQVDEVISALLDEDEHPRDVDPNAAKPQERYAIVRIDGEAIEGLPARAPRTLKERLKDVARELGGAEPTLPKPTLTPGRSSDSETIDIVFNGDDLLLGGTAHKVLLETTLRRARYRVVVHSTFISAERFQALLPLMKDAARRGVQIDVLWGKSTDGDGGNSTAAEVEKCRALLNEDYLQDKVRLHSFTTNSHAKLLIADNGRGQMVAALGSCNWFSSGFESFDVSCYFSDPLIVGDLAGKLATMTVAGTGYWNELARDLGSLGSTLRRAGRPTGAKAKAKIVLGSDHGEYVRLARDEAKQRIVIASHRFSDNAETAVLIPAKAAMEAHDINVTLFYGRTAGPEDGRLARSLASEATERGIHLRQIYRPRLHAKILAWDDDSVVVTSQNWLSADPPDSNPYSEIGVYLSSPGLAKELVQLTELALSQ